MSFVSAARPSSRIKYQPLEIAGQTVGLLTAGVIDAPPLLLVHGFSGDALTWQFTVGALARNHRVFAIDLPGHGQTDTPASIGYWRDMLTWLAHIIDTLGIEQPHMIGHSLGARILLGLVEEGLAMPPSLSLIACAGISPGYDYAFLDRLTRIETLDDALACARQLLGESQDNPDKMARALHQKLTSPVAKAALKLYLSHNFVDGELLPESPVRWERIHCPLQIIWGNDDRIVQIPPQGWLPENAEIHLLDRVGHLPHVTASAPVNRLLMDFASRAEGQSCRVSA